MRKRKIENILSDIAVANFTNYFRDFFSSVENSCLCGRAWVLVCDYVCAQQTIVEAHFCRHYLANFFFRSSQHSFDRESAWQSLVALILLCASFEQNRINDMQMLCWFSSRSISPNFICIFISFRFIVVCAAHTHTRMDDRLENCVPISVRSVWDISLFEGHSKYVYVHPSLSVCGECGWHRKCSFVWHVVPMGHTSASQFNHFEILMRTHTACKIDTQLLKLCRGTLNEESRASQMSWRARSHTHTPTYTYTQAPIPP